MGTVEEEVNMTELIPDNRYTLYETDGTVQRGTFLRYSVENGIPKGRIAMNNVTLSLGHDPSTRISAAVTFFNRVKQTNIGTDQDTVSVINSFLGGKSRRKSTKKRKSRRKSKKKVRRKQIKKKIRRKSKKKRR